MEPEVQRLYFIQGAGGTGKSTGALWLKPSHNYSVVTKWICVLLQRLPLKAASHLIKGRTLHNLFKLGFNSSYGNQLKAPKLDELADDFKDNALTILDEHSMVGLERLSQINSRLQQIGSGDQLLGGTNFMFLGDVQQLSPVLDLPLYEKV